MADQFQNPPDQAQLSQLYAALTALDADVKAMQGELTAQSAAIRESQYQRRAGGAAGSRTTVSAVPALEAEVKAIDDQVVSYTALNELIAQRIKLEEDAAVAARGTAAATASAAASPAAAAGTWAAERQRILGIASMGSAPAVVGEESAAAQAYASLQRLKAQGGMDFQTAGSAQRVMNAISSGSIGGSGAAASGASKNMNELSAAQERAAQTARMLATGELDARDSILSAAVAVQEYDTRLATSGALSGAALTALGNGTLTLRDLGHQVTETIGKFGGWTLAAASVYGVLGALNEVRQGAVSTSSTLTGLTKFLGQPGQPRFDQSAAREQIIRQGQQTATPLNDVGDAAQQFAKIFHNQGDVFTATHVALTAAKLDNIDLADSYKYLTAIVQETGVGAQALPGIFDQITSAQDRLGARVSQLLPAFAGAVGAVKTAGGDPSQLLGLQSLALVRTGRTGSVVGTAFARGATNFFPTANSRGILERYHVDPNQGVTQALIEALQKSPNWSGATRRQVSTAFFGSLRGSLLAPLFNAPPEQLAYHLSQTAAGANPGLANRQLATTVGQSNNQIELLKVNLQAIGAELTGSKFTSPFGTMLHALNDALTLTTRLQASWNTLPEGFKSAASYATLIAAGLATARRFDLGGMLSRSGSSVLSAISPVFTRNPEAIIGSQVNGAMKGLDTTINSGLQSASVQQMRASLALAQAQAQMAALTQAGIKEGEAYDAALAAAADAHAKEATAVADISFYQGLSTAESQAGMRAGLTGMAQRGASGVEGPLMEGGAFYTAGAATKGGAISQALRGQATNYAELAAAQEEMLGTTALTTGAMARLTAVSATVAEGLSTLASMAIPGAIAAFIAYAGAQYAINKSQTDYRSSVDAISKAKTPEQAYQDYRRAADSGVSLGPLHLGAVGHWLTGDSDAAYKAYQNQAGYLHGLKDVSSTGQSAAEVAMRLESEGRYRAAYERLRTDTASRFVGSVDAQGPFGMNVPFSYQNMLTQYKVRYYGNAVTGGKGVNPFAQWEQAGSDLKNRLAPMFQATSDAAKIFGSSSGEMNSLVAGYAYAVEDLGKNGAKDTQAMQLLATAQSGLVSALDKQVGDLMNLATSSSSDKGQQGYYQKALGAINATQARVKAMFAAAEKVPGAPVKELQQAAQVMLGQVATRRQSVIDGMLQLSSSETAVSVSKIIGVGPGFDLSRAETQLQGLQRQLSQARSMGADAQKINDLEQQVNGQLNTVLQDRINYWTQLAQANIAVATGQTANPVTQASIQINQLTQLLAHLRAAGVSPNSDQYKGVVGQIESLGLTKTSGQISQTQAQFQDQLSAQNIGQPTQVQLRNNQAEAERFLAYLKTLPTNQVDPNTMYAAVQAVNDAKGAVAQWMIQEGANLISADAALKESKTFDPVAIANDELQKAKKILAYDLAHNAPASQIASDKATIGNDLKAKLEARWQRAEQTIQFLASTYKITGAQEIDRLKKLLATMKQDHASYADIQRVKGEIYNLEYGGGDLNLNTGSMHLPSTYEVKSALQRGKQVTRRRTAAGLVADVKTDVKMNVYVHRDADVRKVAKAISDALGTSVHGLTQAAGIMD